MDKLKIIELEKELFKSEVRKSFNKINDLLSKDFFEFTSSGKEYKYKIGDVFQEDDKDNNWEIVSYEIKELSESKFLITYKLIKHDEINENKKYSLRSSIWGIEDGKMKMLFHQGTLSNKFDL